MTYLRTRWHPGAKVAMSFSGLTQRQGQEIFCISEGSEQLNAVCNPIEVRMELALTPALSPQGEGGPLAA